MDQVLKAIQQLEKNMNQKFETMDQKFEKKFESMDKKFDDLTTNMNQRFDRLEETIKTVAETANQDTLVILKRIDKNTGSINKDVEYLSKQTGKHEMFFNRLNKN